MAYTKDGVMAQMLVAFGQGTGPVRVSRDACAAFHSRYYGWIDEALLGAWATEAVQVLERVRAIGRRLAFEASLEGRTAISGATLLAVARAVEEGEDCPWCPVQGEKAGRPSPTAKATARDEVLSQMLVAFGQGTGAMRVSHDACLAFRARYESWIDERILGVWGAAAVQILERVRAIGRLLAAHTGLEGRTAIAAAGVEEAARFVEETEDCPYCPIHQERRQAPSACWEESDASLPVV
jgi:hypothetical protein